MNAHEFWSRVDVRGPKDCWEWRGHRAKTGYGVLQLQGHKYLAHRIAWTRVNGDIPAGMLVCHKCDNPPCCNPAHLFLGTYVDNAQDRNAKGRQARGSANGRAQLDEYLVRELRRMYATGRYTYKKLARMYGVSYTVVANILNEKLWKGVDWENF